jgi:HlyD family secretion protein
VEEVAALVVTPVPPPSDLVPLPARPPQRGRRSLRLAVLILALMPLAAGAYWYWWLRDSQPPPFQTARVDRGSISATVTATGTINPVISVLVGSQVSGKIKTLYADFNSVVTKGQVIAQIEPDPFKARVNQARATLRNARGNLGKAQADLDQHKIELKRALELRRQEFVPQSDLDMAKTNVRDAEAQIEVAAGQVDQATAALAAAELDLGYTTITSPVNGIVVSRNVDVGQTVAATLQAPTLFVIAQDLTRMQVNANVSESDIGGVTEGRPAEFTVDAFPHEPFHGTVVQVRNAPISIQNVVTYDVVIGVDNRDLKLKPGMTANVSIETAHKDDALRVPNTALRFKMPGVPTDRKKPVLWVPDATGQPQAIPIKPGIADATYTEVADGAIREGDSVVVGIETEEEPSQKELPPGFGIGPRIR